MYIKNDESNQISKLDDTPESIKKNLTKKCMTWSVEAPHNKHRNIRIKNTGTTNNIEQ